MRFILVIILSLHVIWLRAQDRYNFGFFRSIPVGDYKSTDLENGSFAKPGWGGMIEIKSRFESWPEGLHLGFHLSYQENEMDDNELAKGFTEALGYETEIGTSSYKPFLVTIGPYYDVDVSEKIFIGAKTGIGVMFTNIDSFVIDVFTDQGSLFYNEVLDFEGGATFTYLLGLQLGVRLSEKSSIGLFADYSSANEKVNAVIGNIDSVQSKFKLSFINTGINLTVGF